MSSEAPFGEIVHCKRSVFTCLHVYMTSANQSAANIATDNLANQRAATTNTDDVDHVRVGSQSP